MDLAEFVDFVDAADGSLVGTDDSSSSLEESIAGLVSTGVFVAGCRLAAGDELDGVLFATEDGGATGAGGFAGSELATGAGVLGECVELPWKWAQAK